MECPPTSGTRWRQWDPCHGESSSLGSAGPDEPTVNVGPCGYLVVGVAETKALTQHVVLTGARGFVQNEGQTCEKPSIWSQISSSILTMLSTRSSESETSVVVVIFPKLPSRKKRTSTSRGSLRFRFQFPTLLIEQFQISSS